MAHKHNPPRPRRRFRMRWGRLFGFLLVIGVVVPLVGLGWSAFRLRADAKALKSDFHAHNYVGMASTIQKMSSGLGAMHTEAILLGWMDAIPVVRGYYMNGMTLLTAAYKELDVFGRVLPPIMEATHSPGNSALRAQKIKAAVTHAGVTLARLSPELRSANASIQAMNPRRMPGFLQNKGLNVVALQTLSDTLIKWLPAMTGPHPVLANLLGLPNLTRYLLVFQNSGELRATGGFMTAYAFITFHDGKLGKIQSHGIQQLDTQVTYHPAAPLPVSPYLPVSYWHLRDANTGMPSGNGAVPDVPEAVNNIMRFYNSIPNAPYLNGIVFVNTWLVDSLIADVGGLTVPTVPGKSIHLTPQNANFEMEMMAEGGALPPKERKVFIGRMMRGLMHDIFHGHLSELLKVAGTFSQGLNREEVIPYFHNGAAEQLVAAHHWGGIIPAHVHGDFVEVVDQNLLGHKDNYWMHESYHVNITSEKGGNLETVTVHWMTPAIVVPKPPYLVVPYRSWVTVFAPPGSNLVSMTGSASGGNGQGGGINSYVQQYYDPILNKLEFGAHMTMPGRMSAQEPPAQGTVVTKFWLPKSVSIHRIVLQKQPGLKGEPVTVTVNGVTRHIILQSRTTLTF